MGRFAPSPSGRMHLGNLYAGLLAWLRAKSQGGQILLRIEDLILCAAPKLLPGRSSKIYSGWACLLIMQTLLSGRATAVKFTSNTLTGCRLPV